MGSQPRSGMCSGLLFLVLCLKSRWSSLMEGESGVTPKEGIWGAPRLLLDVSQPGEDEEMVSNSPCVPVPTWMP